MDAPPRIPHSQHARSESHGRGPPLSGNLYIQYEEPSPPDTIISGNYTTDPYEVRSAKRQRLSEPSATGTGQGILPRTSQSNVLEGPVKPGNTGKAISASGPTTGPAAPAGKSRRVRTGCLTCRDRHLKCDEGLPDCLNCRKSNRECSRGIRLNFIDVQVKRPPYMPPPTAEWSIDFKDESRAIASEYQGGVERYVPFDQQNAIPPRGTEVGAAFQSHRQRADVQEPILPFNSGGRDFGRPQSQAMYFPEIGRPTLAEPSGYHEPYGQPHGIMPSRRNSEPYIHVGQQPQPIPPQLMPGSGFGNTFSLASLLERFPVRDDGLRANHSYRSSDVSSVTSSLVPIGAGHTSQIFNPILPPGQPSGGHEGSITPPNEKTTGERDYLSNEDEIFYMQVFIREVAIWMDSFDHQKHFSRIVPYLALKSSMLLNAVLACGVKHLVLTDKDFDDNRVSIYYDTATSMLLRSLQNPDRNMAECAATAAVLNVYEIMSEGPQARMSHIAGARALIRECGWDARSAGIGGACFWLNIGMEVLSCLAFNWKTAWDPDHWGLDVSFISGGGEAEGERDALGGAMASSLDHRSAAAEARAKDSYRYNLGGGGDEEEWVHRIFYIVARIANFRANIPRFQEPSPHDEQVRLQSRFAEWKHLKAMSDRWNDSCPRPMRPYGYAYRRSSKSLFPNIWLIRRAAVVGRLFYHTAMCLLAQINPLNPRDSEENRAAQLHHAHQVCGIVAHTHDHGVASVAIRSLAIASSVLTDGDEQREVLAILDRIHRDTGWRLGTVLAELKRAWNWREPGGSAGGSGSGSVVGADGNLAPLPSAPLMPRPVNPLLAKADFSLPDHPYRSWYRPPNGPSAATARGLWCP